MAGMHSPIAQFEVHTLSQPLFDLAGHPIAVTNFSVAVIAALVLGSLIVWLPFRARAVIPGRWQVIVEGLHNFLQAALLEAAGPKARPFLPFIFSLFFFILLCNMIGLVPTAYTATSQIVANLTLAFTVIAIVLTTGFMKHGAHFFHIFIPSGVPMALVPFISAIEVISFFIRPFSLSLRLFGNMLAGHILLKVFAGMTAAIATSGWVATAGVFPLIMNVAIVGFEFFVALLQAYIFTVLSSVYLRDALEMH